MTAGKSNLLKCLVAATVLIAALTPAKRAEASVACANPGLLAIWTLGVPLVGGLAGAPAYAGKQGKGSLALGGGANGILVTDGFMHGAFEARADVLGEWGRHGYRATSFLDNTTDCGSRTMGSLALSYSYRLLDRDGSVVRFEVGGHAHLSGVGPVFGISYDGRLSESVVFGARLRNMPAFVGFGTGDVRVRTRLRGSMRLQWRTRGKFHPYFELVGGNTFGPTSIIADKSNPWTYANGLLGVEFRSEGDW